MPLILGIESSCDETAAAVVDPAARRVLSSVVASQYAQHAPFGGVVPELASRQHLRDLPGVVDQALAQAGLHPGDLAGVAATCGPGLAGSLLVGLSYAKGLAAFGSLPFLGCDHIEGHLLAAFLEHPGLDFPFVALVVSGGHSSLYSVTGWEARELMGRTRDDAAGEAFDKVAKLLGLPWPGGPALARAAESWPGEGVAFPRTHMKDHSLDFSFSGLKTSVLWHLKGSEAQGQVPALGAVAKGFQAAAVDALVKNVLKALDQSGHHRVVLGGGVAANQALRHELARACAGKGAAVFAPSAAYCTDNAAMIAFAGGLRLLRGERSPWDLGVSPSRRH